MPEAHDLRDALVAPRVVVAAPSVEQLTDDQLLAEQRRLAEERRQIDSRSALVAGEIERRSRRELGYSGLAQSRGARTPEALVQQLTGLSASDARSLVRVGSMLSVQPTPGASPLPWLAPVAAAVEGGALGIDAADAIRAGLGQPNEHVPPPSLASAAAKLVQLAGSLTLERLASRARRLRDELDENGIALRENERRDRRYLTLTPLADGMTRISGLLDPESAAIVSGAVDAITSPRRGGPRFLDPAEAPASAALDDERTVPQLMLDALVDLVKIATLADTGKVLGAKRVAVRVHVAERDLRRGSGPAFIEGQKDAVSLATARRHVCESGMLPVVFDRDGQAMNLGRTQRTFSIRQRVALAARDGGCRFPGCERPPSWTEAHHINEWQSGGRTDIADGILLCRHHHLLIHNNAWRVTREGAEYWLHPPARADRIQHPQPMPSKHESLHERVAR
jgi:hypothetical protein